jgi:TolA-binding protein
MNLFHRCCGNPFKVLIAAICLVAGSAVGQDYSSMGISAVVGAADQMLRRGDYDGAIPPLEEVVRRTRQLTDTQGLETLQTCRFQLARAYFQTSDIEGGMYVLEAYMTAEPRAKERTALRMMAQGYFEAGEWEKIESVATRLLAMPDLEPEDIFTGNLLMGQSFFRQERWADCVKPLSYAADHAQDDRTRGLCEIMIVRALVELEDWSELFGWITRLYRTDAKYDITLNLTLMKAGKARYEEASRTESKKDYLNALLLYRMVLPREELATFSNNRIASLSKKLNADKKIGIKASDVKEREQEIETIKESLKTLDELPAYEDEVTFRIGQIYAEVKRYWEGYVLFDKLYRTDRTSEIGEASMLQSVLILYDVGERPRAEERILRYLDERPDGQYARTLLSMMVRDNLVEMQDFDKVVGLLKYIDLMPAPQDTDEKSLQADIHYMGAFGHFQKKDYKLAGDQFSIILDKYSNSLHFADSRYFRGMTQMLQGEYAGALTDFRGYQERYAEGEHHAAAMFREAVCLFGSAGTEKDEEQSAQLVRDSEAAFTKFINTYPDNSLISEAYSMRGDIEAAKEASIDDPDTLDRALADYRKGIDKATSSLQASYPAFQAAKVYKLEFKWQDIIDLMNYYMDRWEEKADVAEAVYWIGQSQIELGQIAEAVEAYLSAIGRFGNDPLQQGVDKIILELVNVADQYLSDEERNDLLVKIKFKQTSAGEREDVLALRLDVAKAMLEGDEASLALGSRLIAEQVSLGITTPTSLALMCDAAVANTDIEQMGRLYEYFVANYEESDLLWHAYRAKTHMLLAKNELNAVIDSIAEAQGLFGADSFMGWAQIIKADTELKMKQYETAEASFNMVMGVAEWRGPIFAEAMYGMGLCRMGRGDYATAHSFFQRTYLLFKSYADGEWAAKGYLAAADCLIKLGRDADAVNTLQKMLEDTYTNTNPLTDQARDQLKKLGVQ